jgi:hypothetical protein
MQYVKLGESHRQQGDGIWDEDCYEGKTFRRRFRVPFHMFDDIVREYDKVDDRCDKDRWGHPKSSSHLLVLGALRVLAQYPSTFDAV